MSQHEYLGDGVYVEWTGEIIALRTGDHRNPVAVCLEPEVMGSLIRFYQKARQETGHDATETEDNHST